MIKSWKMIFISIFLTFISFPIYFACIYLLKATTLPQFYGMIEAQKDLHEVDKNLFEWLNELKGVLDFTSITEKDLDSFTKDLDEVSQSFLKLYYLRHMNQLNSDNIKEFIDKAKAWIILYEQQQELSPMIGYFLKELFYVLPENDELKKFIYQSMIKIRDKSCPQKEALLQEMNNAFSSTDDFIYYSNLLRYISSFNSRKFKEKSYITFLAHLPYDKQAQYQNLLYEILKDYPNILEDNLWILQNDPTHPLIQKQQSFQKEATQMLYAAIDESKKKHCRTAKINLENALKQSSDKDFDLVLQVLSHIETCIRSTQSYDRLQFWSDLEEVLEASYGFKGKFISLKKQGLIHWGEDNFSEAKKIFKHLLDLAKQNNDEAAIEYCLYILARINENEGNIEEAINYFSTLIRTFKNSEKYTEALMNLVILNVQLSKLKTALYYAQELLSTQSSLSANKVSLSTMGFALFWLGRIHYSLGNTQTAAYFFQRNALEFYSTYYGFLSHFYLEKILNKKYELQPYREISFDKAKVLERLSKEDKILASRIEILLKFGFKDNAVCEINEFSATEDNQDKLFLKSLFQYAVGDWLNAVKNYNYLTRTYRHALPKGSEKLLFPTNYEQLIRKYSNLIKLDPHLIFAIIRQESVFNSKARSPVGARGLMQLMPNTAKVEIKSLAQQKFLNFKLINQLKKIQTSSILYDAEVNIMLGVHHLKRLYTKYNNVIYALAAYNANTKVVDKWIANFKTTDPLIFIERIPYSETKDYVKLILRNYFYYKRWYSGVNSSLPHLNFIAKNLKLKSIKAEAPVAPQL